MTVHPPKRLASLDAFRGLTIAAMILVNSPGNDQAYAFLAHSPWHGWTLADLVFPSFLLIMGASSAISLGRRLDRGEQIRRIYFQILWRGALIFFLGFLASAVLTDPSEKLRWPGVLQRIAACYLLCSLIFIKTRPVIQASIAGLLLAGYWLLLTVVPVPGHGPGVLTPEGNLASYLDRTILGGHLFAPTHDPEGILSTLSALATTLFGILAGQWLRSSSRHSLKAMRLLSAGCLALAVGWFWGLFFPINKNLWTSSFVFFSGGAALVGLSACYWLIEVMDFRVWARPFEIFGRNPLLSYLLSGFIYDLQEFIKLPLPDSRPGNIKLWLGARLFDSWLSRPNAALAYALAYTGICLGLMEIFYRKKIFLKI